MTSSLVAWGERDASLVKAWGKDVVPLLSHEWVSNLLLSLLLFKVSWVFTARHWISYSFKNLKWFLQREDTFLKIIITIYEPNTYN